MINANADSTYPQFKTCIADTALHDVVAHHSPEASNQSTYINCQKRLDYMLVTEDILFPSIGAGYTPYGSSFISYHRGVYWDIPSAVLFESILPGPITVPQRGLQLNRPRKIQKYIEHLPNMYTKHKIFEKTVSIENKLCTETSQKEKEKLYARFSDLDMERAHYMYSADKKCKLISMVSQAILGWW